MFPLYDLVPRLRPPLVMFALIGVNLALFIHELSLPPLALNRFIFMHGMVPLRLANPAWAREAGFPSSGLTTPLTSMFLHAGWFHLLGNLWMLWIFGDNVEDRLGRPRFLLFYLACGVAAAATQFVVAPHSSVPVVGASGAIAGVMGGYLRLYPRARVVTLIFFFILVDVVALPAWLFLGWWILLQLFQGSLDLAGSQGAGVAFWAHVGGFLAGMLLVRLLDRGEVVPRGPWRTRPAWRHRI